MVIKGMSLDEIAGGEKIYEEYSIDKKKTFRGSIWIGAATGLVLDQLLTTRVGGMLTILQTMNNRQKAIDGYIKNLLAYWATNWTIHRVYDEIDLLVTRYT